MFIDPYSGEQLQKDSNGDLYCKKGDQTVIYKNHDGCFDFVSGPLDDIELKQERDYYDKEYVVEEPMHLLPADVKGEWFDKMTPWRTTLLRSLGELSGKRILLVGNGETTKEMYFAMAGADVIYTDLSIEGVKQRKKQFENSEISHKITGSIEFHAIDAQHLPFLNDSFDIIYGAIFVHHLSNVDKFLDEVFRCLRTGGICRFLDQASSPLWELMQKVLWPLKKYSYRRDPRSPGDIRSDREGGMTKENSYRLMMKHGFRTMLFEREWFFFRIVTRHYGKIFKHDRKAMALAKPLFQFAKRIDILFAKTNLMRKNALMLTWGFSK